MLRTYSRLCNATIASRRVRFATIRLSSSTSSESQLGLRFHHPPDGQLDSSSPEPPKADSELSDAEWEIRTGRAIRLIQQTLPQFFETGLMVSFDTETGTPQPSTYGALSHSFGQSKDNIYSPKVRLEYTPPVHLPTPLPQTLHIQGLPLYLASSVFVRHTLNALYSDLHVNLTKFVVDTPKQGRADPDAPIKDQKPLIREKSIFMKIQVTGNSRVSGADGHWDVTCTYTFSPKTGLISSHLVNNIHPTPSDAVYDSLRANIARLMGVRERAPAQISRHPTLEKMEKSQV